MVITKDFNLAALGWSNTRTEQFLDLPVLSNLTNMIGCAYSENLVRLGVAILGAGQKDCDIFGANLPATLHNYLARVVQNVYNTSVACFVNTYPLNSDLSSG